MPTISMPMGLKIYAICCVILFFKMAIVGFTQGALKAKTKTFTNPEDAKLNKVEVSVVDAPEVIKAGNALRNDLENIPMFLFLALVYVMTNCWDRGSLIYFSIFTFARILHSLFYINGVQPWRSISYGIGIMMSVIISGHIVYQVFMT